MVVVGLKGMVRATPVGLTKALVNIQIFSK
jgi:hypothetical protein